VGLIEVKEQGSPKAIRLTGKQIESLKRMQAKPNNSIAIENTPNKRKIGEDRPDFFKDTYDSAFDIKQDPDSDKKMPLRHEISWDLIKHEINIDLHGKTDAQVITYLNEKLAPFGLKPINQSTISKGIELYANIRNNDLNNLWPGPSLVNSTIGSIEGTLVKSITGVKPLKGGISLRTLTFDRNNPETTKQYILSNLIQNRFDKDKSDISPQEMQGLSQQAEDIFNRESNPNPSSKAKNPDPLYKKSKDPQAFANGIFDTMQTITLGSKTISLSDGMTEGDWLLNTGVDLYQNELGGLRDQDPTNTAKVLEKANSIIQRMMEHSGTKTSVVSSSTSISVAQPKTKSSLATREEINTRLNSMNLEIEETIANGDCFFDAVN
ncbi:MAG: hypothetical protein ACK4IX_16375, partial [Candidatus Sericytochromatia bacterium]